MTGQAGPGLTRRPFDIGMKCPRLNSENCKRSIAVETSPLLIDPKSQRFCFFVLQIMDGLYQLSQSPWLDGVPSLLEVHDCGPGNSGLAREQLIRKLLRFCPDSVQVFRINHSFVLARSLIRRVTAPSEMGDSRLPIVPSGARLLCCRNRNSRVRVIVDGC
jgi:hypothetical protein